MLKYLYSGKFPGDPQDLITELLQLADMHQLHSSPTHGGEEGQGLRIPPCNQGGGPEGDTRAGWG